MAIKSLSLSLALVAVVALPVAAKAASDCPGDEMTAVPYADSGGFPTGLDDLNPIGLDLTACGAPGPIGQNGPDFVVTIPVGAQTAMLDCTLTSTGPALVVWGLAEPCGYPGGGSSWAEDQCSFVDTGTTVTWSMGFFGEASIIVDALGTPSAQFTLNCDGTLPVELQMISVE